MPGDTILSANGATFTQNNCIVDSFTDLYANNIYYKTINGTTGATNYGYSTGGSDGAPISPGVPPSFYNTIRRWPFALSITNSTNVGTLSATVASQIAVSSSTYGYVGGGWTFGSPSYPMYNSIQRWPFSLAITNSSSVGTLVGTRTNAASSQSTNHGYNAQGRSSPTTSVDTIERWPFALAITNAANVGTVATGQNNTIPGTQSIEYGYTLSGTLTAPPAPPPTFVVLTRWPFALAITNSVNAGNLSRATASNASTFSTDYGYSLAGWTPTTTTSSFERFPFALAITSGVTVGNLTQARTASGAGSSSSTYGYVAGGYPPGFIATNIIDRFPFALAITNAASVGTLNVVASSTGSHQY